MSLRSSKSRCSRSVPNRSYSSWCLRSSWPGFQKSCCPTETVARSTRPAPPSPTPLPSATDSHWPPNSHKALVHLAIRINLRQPRIRVIHRRQTRLLRPRIAPLHTVIPIHRLHRMIRRLARTGIVKAIAVGSWPNYRPTAIDCSSPDSCPCKTPTHTRSWGWHRSRHPECPPS